MQSRFIWFLIILLWNCGNSNQGLNDLSTTTLFKEIPSSFSGITFKNQLKENLSTGENVLDFDFFFNGAGVAVADFDNDGLEDIFFTGNQVENRIYKNDGDLKFTDKTNSSGILNLKNWSNGVTCSDVNGDGFLDIYVCQGGPLGPEKRANLLFINNGDFTFSERAKEFGLADNGISTQAAFFDYDKDGDLDCFVMNESPLIGLDPISFYSLIRTHSSTLLNASSSHLYRNDDGRYTDISTAAGVLLPSFGLGLCISDINNDNWLDIYIANDYYIPDAVYINDTKGGFLNETKSRLSQSSFYSMGLDIADINNDGHQDIYLLDMATEDHVKSKTLMASMDVANFDLLTKDFDFPYQYMFNSMQLNNGMDRFNNIAHFSGTSKTDWSWACLIEDFDQDGHKDIFVSNGYRKYARDNDFQTRVTNLKNKYGDNEIPLAEKEALYKTVPSEKLANIFYQQSNPLRFDNMASKVGLNKPSFSNGAVSVDLDNDGDLDLVVNNIDEEAFLYENKSERNGQNYLKVKLKSKLSDNFAKVKIYYDGKVQLVESKRVRGYLSSLSPDIYFGLGKAETIDSLIVTWTNGKMDKHINVDANQTLTLSEVKSNNKTKGAVIAVNKKFVESSSLLKSYKHVENHYNDFELETLLPYKQSVSGPNIQVLESSKDKTTKIFTSASLGQNAELYALDGQISSTFNTKDIEIADAIFLDIDKDGDKDAYLVSGGNEQAVGTAMYADRLFINNNGNFSVSQSQPELNPNSSGKTGAALDFDKDGDEDLMVCNRIIPKKYPSHAPSILFENDGGVLIDVTAEKAPELADFGIINAIEILDFNQDGWMDFLVVGEWTGIGLFKNQNGKFEDVSQSFQLDNLKGWWFSITATDINKDNKTDYVIGNLGLNSKYKATTKKPLSIYGHDFDENGTFDQVLSYEYKGKEVPFRGRQCSSEQMPFIKEKFTNYESFANASLSDVYGNKLDKAVHKVANDFSSVALINSNNGFEVMTLPAEAQLRPILDGVSLDIDKNGYKDLILVGNLYETEVETPRLDYQNATVLLSDGKNYSFSPEYSAQLPINGNSKSNVIIKDKILIGVNDEAVKEFTIVD